jgi:hypothetical protein
MDPFRHRDSQGLHFGHKWLMHFGCANGFLGFVTHFLDEVLFKDVAYIDDFSTLGDTQVALGILF